MKKILILACFCLTLNYISAQNEMWIYKSNGTVVKYNTSEIDSIKFMPSQEPEDNIINISANCLIGNYYGESLVAGLGHYWIILTEDGFADGATVPNSEFFRIDLLGPLADDEENIKIPNGHYYYDPYGGWHEFTVLNIGNTDYLYVDKDGEAWITTLTYAELGVDNNIITLTAIVDDKEYHVTFEGDYNITANIIPETISTLTSDHEIDLSNCSGTVSCYGDYWDCGYCNWSIEFVCNDGLKNGTYFVLDFLTDNNISGTSGFEGTYRSTGFSEEDPTKPAFDSYTFVPGMRVSDDGVHMMGSLLIEYINGVGVNQAPIYGGEFTVKDNGDGTHTITLNATDDIDPANKITLNWTGTLKH